MIHFIVNPNSRSGQGGETWKELYKKVQASGIEHTVSLTEYPGHAIKLAKQAHASKRSSDEKIVVMGGDGSLNEVVTGLPLGDCPIIGFIPSGSGNDFARGLDLPTDPDEALDVVLNAELSGSTDFTTLDIGEVEYGEGLIRRFAVSGGCGYDAAVCDNINKSVIKKIFNAIHLGKFAYPIIGVKQWLVHPRVRGVISFDNGKSYSFKGLDFISAHNLKYEGGGYPFAPDADPTDGLISLCIVAARNRLAFFAALLPSKNIVGWHTKFKGIKIVNCKKARIHLNKKLTVHTDGEIVGYFDDFTFRMLGGAVRLMK